MIKRIRKSHLITLLFLIRVTGLFSQQVHKQTLTYTPEGNGYACRIPIAWKFLNCFGTVELDLIYISKEVTSSSYLYNGKTYNATQLGGDAFSKIPVSALSVQADVYDNTQRLGTITINYVMDVSTECYGTSVEPVIEQLGLDNADYKSHLETLTLRNVKITEGRTDKSLLDTKIKDLDKQASAGKQSSGSDALVKSIAEKRKTYLSVVEKGNASFSSGNYQEASRFYNQALTLDFDPDMYPDLPARYSIIQKYARCQQAMANSKPGNQTAAGQNARQSGTIRQQDQTEAVHAVSQSVPSGQNNPYQYKPASSAGSSESPGTSTANRNGSSSNAGYEIYRQYQQNAREIESSSAEIANDVSALVTGVFNAVQANRQAEMEAQQRRLEEERRKREEEDRIFRRKQESMHEMDAFRVHFASFFNRELEQALGGQCIYFYFGSMSTHFESESGELQLSNIFPVYRMDQSHWPFISDILDKIYGQYGDGVIIRGYFNTKEEAERDMTQMIREARNTHISWIKQDAWSFSFNSPSVQSSDTDFWGNKIENKPGAGEVDFWGNPVGSGSKKTDAPSDTTGTNNR